MRRKPFSSSTEDPPKTEPMSNVDTAWLRMEEATNQMTITAVLTFSAPVGVEDFRRVLEERLLIFDRFRQRVRRGRGGVRNPRWEPDPHFDLDAHLKRATLPAPGSKAQLQELVGTLMSRPLDFARPLWTFHVVEGYEEGGAVVARFHHCIADGVTLVRVLLSLTDATPQAPAAGAPGQQELPALDAAGREQPRKAAVQGALSGPRRLLSAAKRSVQKSARAAEMAARSVGVAGKLAWPTPDPDTALRGTLGRAKRAAWSAPVPLADVKALGKTLGGTVNDVLLAAVTGALRRYLQQRGDDTDGLDVRAAVPVNLRRSGTSLTMGNAFGLVFLALPVGVDDPVERLQTLHRRMNHLKRSPEAPLVMKLLGAVGAMAQAVQDRVVTFLARKVTAVATNVPGPQRPLYLAGAPLETVMAWVPQAGRVGLGVSVISYDGTVRLGLATDAGIVPDPEAIIDAFYDEFDALLHHLPGRAHTTCRPDETSAREEQSEDAAPSSAQEEPATKEPASPQRQTSPDPDRCQATTKAGTQCKLPAQDGSRFCHVHG